MERYRGQSRRIVVLVGMDWIALRGTSSVSDKWGMQKFFAFRDLLTKKIKELLSTFLILDSTK